MSFTQNSGDKRASFKIKRVAGELEEYFKAGSFSPSEDGQERPLRFLQGHGKVVELLLHQETGGLLRKIHSHHGAGGGEEGETMKMGLKMGLKNKIPEMLPWLTCGPCEPCRRRR